MGSFSVLPIVTRLSSLNRHKHTSVQNVCSLESRLFQENVLRKLNATEQSETPDEKPEVHPEGLVKVWTGSNDNLSNE